MEKIYSVLIVDDDPDDQFLIRDAFKALKPNFLISIANNGAELLDVLKPQKDGEPLLFWPDFILLDVNMPLVNGFEALRRLKGNDGFKSIPVFMLSTTMEKEQKDLALGLGAEHFFIKPTNMTGYQNVVETIFSNLGARG